jgi:ABC-2 type transport system permease protein
VAELGDARSPAIPATTQLLAIAWLRWRMFVNSLFRRTGERKTAGLVLAIVLRVIAWPIFALWVIGPAFGSGVLAWMAIHDHHPQRLAPLLAGIAIGWQFIAVNGVSMAATLSTFDPATLLRFPLRFGRYLVLRLLLGLLTPSTLVGCLALVGAFAGITVADASLAPAAFVVLAVYAAMNLFFSRMIAVWLERWLAARRAREIFGALMALLVVGVQFVNFGGWSAHPRPHTHAANGNWLVTFSRGSHAYLAWLPPGFATQSILAIEHPLLRLAQFAALLAWTAAFFAALAYRLKKQFMGEYLSEGAPRATAAVRTHPRPLVAAAPEPPATGTLQPATSLLSPIVSACLRKEWLYLRSNGAMVAGLLTPLIFVFILSRGILERHPSYLLAGAIGYALMGPMVGLYNVFGADAAGVQLYLLAPVRLRDVVVAKNIASAILLTVEGTLAWLIVAWLATAPIPLSTQIATVFWIAFIVFSNLAFGTLRSIQAPRKVALAQTRQLRPVAQSKTTGLLVLAVLIGCILLQIPVTYLCRRFHNPWLAAAIFAPLAVVAISMYALLLRNVDRLMLTHRDTLAQELCSD